MAKKVKSIKKQLIKLIVLNTIVLKKQSTAKETSIANFDASVEVAFRLGIDTRKMTNKSVVQ